MQSGQLYAFGSVGKADALVATINQYLFAPATDDQLKVGVVVTAVAPDEGLLSDGTGSSVAASAVSLPTNTFITSTMM